LFLLVFLKKKKLSLTSLTSLTTKSCNDDNVRVSVNAKNNFFSRHFVTQPDQPDQKKVVMKFL
jgi:hypothetical protein